MPRRDSGKTISNSEINWIIDALNHEIATLNEETKAQSSSALKALGNLAIENREALITKLSDWKYADYNTVILTH